MGYSWHGELLISVMATPTRSNPHPQHSRQVTDPICQALRISSLQKTLIDFHKIILH